MTGAEPVPRNAHFSSPPPQSKKRSGCAIAVVAVCIAGVLVFVGGGAALLAFGMDVFTTEIQTLLEDDPVMLEHTGPFELELDFIRSSLEEDDETFVFEVHGQRSDGRLTVRAVTLPSGEEEIRSARLRLPDGATHDLQGHRAEPLELPSRRPGVPQHVDPTPTD